MIKKSVMLATLILSVATTAMAQSTPDPQQEKFQELLRDVQSNPGGTTDAKAMQMVNMAVERDQLYAASLAMKGFLSQHFQPSGTLLLKSAQIAQRVGDNRIAVARYKKYLKQAADDHTAAEAAGEMYLVMIDLLKVTDDAYQHMRDNYDRHRKHVLPRRFDTWFMDQARRRFDYEGMAQFMSVVLAEKMPLEKEKTYYWKSLDWLMSEITHASPKHYSALLHLKRIVPLVRGDSLRQKRYAFYVAQLQFYATSSGQEQKRVDAMYGETTATARQYFDTDPTGPTAFDVLQVLFAGHRGTSGSRIAKQRRQAFDVFSYMFGKVSDADKQRMLGWHNRSTFFSDNSEYMTDLGEAHAAFFQKSPYAERIGFPYHLKPIEVYKRQAKYLNGVASQSAAFSNSLAHSEDFLQVVDYWNKNETWHRPFGGYHSMYQSYFWAAFSQLDRAASLPADTYAKGTAKFMEHACKSPNAIFETYLVRHYLEYAFIVDKANFTNHVTATAWLPYDAAQRTAAYDNVHSIVKTWCDNQRNAATKSGEPLSKELLDQMTAYDRVLTMVKGASAPNLAAAPDAVCRHMAEMHIAAKAGNWGAYNTAARKVYPLVKDCRAKKTPYGRATMDYILSSRGEAATMDMRLEILRDQLTRYQPNTNTPANFDIERVAQRLLHGGPSWYPYRIPVKDKDLAKKVAAEFETALMGMLNRGQFDEKLFDWYFSTRNSNTFRHNDMGHQIAEKIINDKIFHKFPLSVNSVQTSTVPYFRSTTAMYMWLIRNNFPTLNQKDKYPLARYFDDMFVEEALRTKFLDTNYVGLGGLDEEKKINNCAAKVIAGYTSLPIGYGHSHYTQSITIVGQTEYTPFWPGYRGIHSVGKPRDYVASNFWSWQSRALAADPEPRDEMIAAVEAGFGKTRFDMHAAGRNYFYTNTKKMDDQERKEFFGRFTDYVAKVKTLPDRVSNPYMYRLYVSQISTFTEEELDALVSVYPGASPRAWSGTYIDYKTIPGLIQGLTKYGRTDQLKRMAPELWRMARHNNNAALNRHMTEYAQQLADSAESDSDFELALVFSAAALDVMGTSLQPTQRIELTGLRNMCLAKIGGVVPVKKSDRRYPIFAAQSRFLTGRHEAAWDLYLRHRGLIEDTHRDLDPAFTIWLIQRNTESEHFDDASGIAQNMLVWFDSIPAGIDPELRARLLVEYGKISLAQKQFPKARAQFVRIVANRQFNGTRAQGEAELMVANVDRLTKNYESAISICEKITERDDATIQAEAYYTLGLIRFDQEEYKLAKETLDKVFARSSEHENARILEGKVNLALLRLEDVIELQLGTLALQRIIVPGKPLKVSLEDKNLAVIGKATNIEIRAWTESGDEEFFTLLPWADSKTKFRGQITTELAAVEPNDNTIQVLGVDRVFYDFSPKFREENRILFEQPASLTIATDGALYGSSGRILSPAELEADALETLLAARAGVDGPTVKRDDSPLAARRAHNQIKPGNRINLRVEDLDKSATAGVDQLDVRITASSGDRINLFNLSETSYEVDQDIRLPEYSGVFEGSVQTLPGQAVAFATDSLEGHEPNSTISPKREEKEYEPWIALNDGIRPKAFGVDLNDNVPLDMMTVDANVLGHKLKSFEVQTSFDRKNYTTIGSWPLEFKPWDGSLRIGLVTAPEMTELPESLAIIESYFEKDHITDGAKKVFHEVRDMEWDYTDRELWDLFPRLPVDPNKTQLDMSTYYVANFQGAFYQKVRRLREISLSGSGEECQFHLKINGESVGENNKFKGSLAKGVHTIEVMMVAKRKSTPKFELTWDTLEEPFVEPIPADAYSLAKFPQIRDAIYIPPAKITATEEGGIFDIQFDESTRARAVQLLIHDYELQSPAIRSITLSDQDGETRLPTEDDFMDLWENDTLEILSGDLVTVTYTDPVHVSGDPRTVSVHEVSLQATYTNAGISAAFGEFNVSASGARSASYTPMRRFAPGDAIFVQIDDADMDVSDKLDVVQFSAKSYGGDPVKLSAVETGPHTGKFIGRVFPVEGEPEREAEIKVTEDDEIRLTYIDNENTSPGVPWPRTTSIEQVWYKDPEIRTFDVTSRPLSQDELEQFLSGLLGPDGKPLTAIPGQPGFVPEPNFENEYVPVRRGITMVRPEEANRRTPVEALIDATVGVEILFPYIAKSPASRTEIFVQTSTGRDAHNAEIKPNEFDITVPGTIKLTMGPSSVGSGKVPPGYSGVILRDDPYAVTPLDDGRFAASIPIKLGDTPPISYAVEVPGGFGKEGKVLYVNGEDKLFVGFKYADEEGIEHWLTQTVLLNSDPRFDVMDRKYLEPVTGLYVGQNAYFRVLHPSADLTDGKDEIQVHVTTSSGTQRSYTLLETYSHTGIFKGLVKLVYAEDDSAEVDPIAELDPDAVDPEAAADPEAPADEALDAPETPDLSPSDLDEATTLPVTYGDTVTIMYIDDITGDEYEHRFIVFKGYDGSVLPFTKRYEDAQTAVGTQFTIAESYFELAKRHRQLGKPEIAREEIATGQKILDEALRDYPITDARVQYEYLLSNLYLELAKEIKTDTDEGKNDAEKEYNKAVQGFNSIVATYPESTYAPKSQYKKAQSLEKMGRIHLACEEYVKLSYRYPKHELIAETIAALGSYFSKQGLTMKRDAAAQVDPIDAEKILLQSKEMFQTAAEVFGRLAARFPDHNLATLTTVRSAQCYMRAEKWEDATDTFQIVLDDKDADKNLRAEAMYWCGDAYMRTKKMERAYVVFKNLTWDYPESKWAKFARGQLAGNSKFATFDE